MHSWHTGLSARIAPSSRAPEKVEFGSPAISPCALMSSGTGGGPPRPPPPPSPPRRAGTGIISFSRHLPMASKFSRPKPMGSIRRWHDAQVGFSTCSFISCAASLRRLIDERIGQRRVDAGRRRRHVLAEQPLANEDSARRRRRCRSGRRSTRGTSPGPESRRAATPPGTSPSRTAPSGGGTPYSDARSEVRKL